MSSAAQTFSDNSEGLKQLFEQKNHAANHRSGKDTANGSKDNIHYPFLTLTEEHIGYYRNYYHRYATRRYQNCQITFIFVT